MTDELTITAVAYAALRALAVGGEDWTYEPDAAGRYTVEVSPDVAATIATIAAATGATPSDVILTRLGHLSN